MTMENSNLFINNINELIKKKINPILKNGDKKIRDIAFSLDEFEIYKKEKKIRICFFGKSNSGKTSL